jgi:hypothetical protein
VAALVADPASPLVGHGGTAAWLFPTSVVRGLLVYGAVAAWLWVEIGRRPPEDLPALARRAPLLYLGLSWAFLATIVLLHGRAREVWPAVAPVALLRAVAHLAVGYGYVVLVEIARVRLERAGRLQLG